MIPFTPDERRAEFAPSQNQGGPVDPDVLAVIGQPVSQEPAMSQPTIPEPVDPDVLDIVNRDQIPLMSSLMSASRVNPDQAAEASRLGARIGVGQDVALRNMDEVRQRAFMADMQARDIARTNPVLASFLMDRTFANQASDDVGTLEKLAQTMDYVSELPSEFMAGFRTGRITTEAGLLGTTAQLRGKPTEDEQRQWNAYQQELADLAGDTGFWRQTGELLGQIERTAEESVKGAVIGGGIGAGGALLAGQFGPQIFLPEEIVTVPAATIFGMGAGATSAMISTSGRVMAGNNYMKNLDAGMDPDVARVTALGVGLLGGALEVYGVKLLAAPFKGVWSRMVMDAANEAVTRPTVGKAIANFGTSYAKGVGGEIGTEVSQQVVEIAFDEMGGYISDPEAFQSRLATREGRQSIKNELTDVIVRTALGVSAIGGIGPGINIAIDLRRAKQTTKQTKFFESLTQNATESKVRGRDVGAYERFVAAQAAGTNAETVFVDGATMRGVLEQAAVTDSQLDAVVPGLAQKVRDAAATGSDVTIPTAQYAARLAGTDLGNALLPHMRLAPDAISATEAQAVEASRAEIVAQAEKLMEQKQETDAAFVQSAQAVEDSIFNAVKAVGYSDVQARTYAKIHQAMAVVDAAAMGITPEEYNRRFPYRVRGPQVVQEGQPLEQADQFDQAGQRRTDTPQFRAWSNNAQLVTKDQSESHQFATGVPVVVEALHGSIQKGLRKFDVNAAVEVEGAIFFSSNEEVASQYTFERAYGDIISDEPLGEVISAYVSFQNPMVYAPKGRVVDAIEMSRVITQAKELGHDGVIIQNIDDSIGMTGDMGNVYVTWNPTSIKSTDNSGAFSRATADIYNQAATIDADYLAAVERGDMESAQRMVDEAARASGYTIPVYHFTESEQPFTSFDIERGKSGPGIWLTSSPEGWYGRRMDLYLNPGKIENVKSQFDPTWREGELSIEGILEGDLETISQQNIDTLRNTEQYLSTFYVATRPEQVKSADAVTRDEAGNVVPLSRRFDITSPKVFEQAARGPARGGHDPRTLTTVINKGGDITTLFHELIHYKVEVYLRMANAGEMPAQQKNDLDYLFKFMGVAGASFEERLATYNGLTFEQRRPLEEKITYNFEDYLLEGKAPSVEMRGVFDRIAAWMRRVYKSLRDDLNAIYKREFGTDLPILTPEIRAVFDRMLASEEQIKRAEAVNNMKGLFQTQAESGMDDSTWAAYQAMQKEATDEAIAALTADTMKQVEWMSNARSKKLKELQKAHDTQRKEVRDQVMAEVRQEPIYRAMEYLKRGTLIGPDGSEATVEGVHKISTALAREFVPGLDMAKMGRGKYGYLAEDGLHPDIVAEMFGFPAGSALLQALADAKPMREVVDARTDEIMVRDYSEMGDPKAQEAAVNRAIHNEARARLVAVEARWLSKATQPVRVIQEAARQAAVDAVGNTVIRDLRPDQYAAAEARASRDAIEAARGADTKRLRDRYGADATREQIMLQAKRQQLYQNALATEAQKADDAIQKGLKYLRRVLRDSNRQRMGADYADQIAGILERFELAPISRAEAARRADLAAWVEAKRAEGLEPDIDPEVLAESNRRPWRNLTVTEFNAVMDAVKQIEFMGKNERKIKLAAEKADFEKVRDEIVKSVIANAGDRKANARTATTNIGRTITTLTGFFGAHLKAASIARILDGAQDGGPVWNYLIRSANDAGDKETTMRAQATERLTAMFAPIFKLGKMGGKGQYFPTVDRSFNREARLVIALNMGNDGNIQRLLNGESWSIEQITPILQSLTEDEWNLVQQVWDYFETYRPEIAAKERELYGKEPNWVEPKPLIVQTADGKTVTLRGGYYPIKYDPRASMRSETMSDAEVAKRDLAGAFTSATTRRSYTKARVEELKDKRPLLYTLAGMYGGVNEVIHDLSWHRWLIQANRLMRSQAFDEAVRERYGPEFIGQLKTWIKDVAAGERGVQNEAEMALNFLRQGISSAGLGFNVVSAALQITGFNQSIVRVGVKWIGRGIAAVAQSPLLSMKMVNEKSDFMANRSRTQFRELNELRNMVQGDSVAMRRIKMGTYFLMMRMQRMVDVPTWIGAYEKALYEGRDEDTSIALADQAVIDSQGGGMLKDLSRVERGGAGLKLFTVFYGYMNTVYNMAAVQTMTAKNKGKLAADYAMLFVVPVVLGQLIRKAMVPKTEDEPEDLEAIARKLAAEQLSYLMGTMVIVREFGEISKIVAGAEGPRMGYGGPAGLRAVGETYNFATQASQGEFDKAFRKSAVNLIGAFTGLPSAQINRTLDGLDALYEGETENVLAPATGVRR